MRVVAMNGDPDVTVLLSPFPELNTAAGVVALTM
jgi:hypothetical protein